MLSYGEFILPETMGDDRRSFPSWKFQLTVTAVHVTAGGHLQLAASGSGTDDSKVRHHYHDSGEPSHHDACHRVDGRLSMSAQLSIRSRGPRVDHHDDPGASTPSTNLK